MVLPQDAPASPSPPQPPRSTDGACMNQLACGLGHGLLHSASSFGMSVSVSMEEEGTQAEVHRYIMDLESRRRKETY